MFSIKNAAEFAVANRWFFVSYSIRVIFSHTDCYGSEKEKTETFGSVGRGEYLFRREFFAAVVFRRYIWLQEELLALYFWESAKLQKSLLDMEIVF